MKEFVNKLIGRLEEEKQRLRNLKNNCVALSDHEVIAIEEGAYNFCKNIVNELAEEYINTSTDTSSGWIACSERLPEEDGNYLVQQDNGRINILHYCKGWNCTYMDVDKTRWSNACERKDIIAWQPLPAPYKEGVTENE